MSGLNFHDFMRQLERGRALEDIGAAMTDLIHAIQEHGKSGSLTLKLDFKPGDGAEYVHVQHAVTIKKPTRTSQATLFFTTEEDTLTRRNSRQGDIEDHIREVASNDGAGATA